MNQFAIITGASKGIGKSCAELFKQQGWQIINISRHSTTLSGVINFEIDLSVRGWEQSHSELLTRAAGKADKICLIHNAAENHKDNIADLSELDFRRVLEINVMAPHLLNRLFLPLMKPGSSIIYIGSTLSEKAVSNAYSYITTKHALAGMMKATCQDLAGTNIHTACVCPGFTNTEMLRSHLTAKDIEIIRNKICAKRFIEPEEMAQLILFCADNPIINGAVLHGNLGQIGD